MSDSTTSRNLVAIDVGNSRVKFGWFANAEAECVAKAGAGALPIAAPSLPEPAETFAAAPEELAEGGLADWLEGLEFGRVVVASVSRTAEAALAPVISEHSVVHLRSESAPIELRVDEPAKIGVDRVMAAVAANRLRHDGKPAIVIDVGTAITVDLIAPNGALEGGAILPGPGLAARALGEKTDALPDIRFGELDASPDAVGRSTEPAIRAGIYWGCVGAVRELIARQRDRLVVAPQVFLTGGAAPAFARLLGGPDLTVRCLPHLTLSGIALAATASDAS